jgi:PKD repeat protein
MKLVRATVVLSVLLGFLFIPISSGSADVPYQDIVGNGPLDHLYLGNELSCQVATTIDGDVFEFYPPDTIPGDCGTFLAVGGTLYTPDFNNHLATATFFTNPVPFTPVSQSPVTGTGTGDDPYTVVTVANAGADLQIQETDTYVLGDDEFRTDLRITNLSGADTSAVLYRAGDCYLSSSDVGFGFTDPSTGTVGCQEDAGGVPGPRIAEFVPITAGSSFYEAHYSEVWEAIDTRQPFPNTCECDLSQDNGEGLSWNVTIPAGGQADVSHLVRWSSGQFNQPPVALASIFPTNWTGPYTLAFDGTASFDPDGEIVSYEWAFGDGGTSTDPSPSYGYVGPGSFTVSLTVTDDDGATATTFQDLTITGIPSVDFAPEVRLYPEEDHFPMNPYSFIGFSKLVWAHDEGCPNDFEVDPVNAAALGSGGYEHREARSPFRLCKHQGPQYQTNDLTRPFDGHPDRVRINAEEGFYLDFDESNEPGSFSPVPVWTERWEANTVTYWLFYGRSVPRWNGQGLPNQHEGDWEHVNVVLDPATQVPTEIQYFAHKGGADPHPYTDVIRSQVLHPVVYSARTAHGSYPDTGRTEICEFDVCIEDIRADGGDVWETWHDVRSATDQGWYGFGGAWGHKGQAGFLETTGPLGPSRWKNPL